MATPKFKTSDVAEMFAMLDPQLQEMAMGLPVDATITSTYRSPEENASVGGVPNSYHTVGKALDYRIKDQTPESITAITDYFTGQGFKVINEGDHLHIEPGKGGGATSTPKNAADMSLEDIVKLNPIGKTSEDVPTPGAPTGDMPNPADMSLDEIVANNPIQDAPAHDPQSSFGGTGATGSWAPLTPAEQAMQGSTLGVDNSKIFAFLGGVGRGAGADILDKYLGPPKEAFDNKIIEGVNSVFGSQLPSATEMNKNRNTTRYLSESKNPGTTTLGEIAGFMLGPGKLSKAAGEIQTAGRAGEAIKTALIGAGEGGTFEALTNPEADLGSVAKSAAIGAPAALATRAAFEAVGLGKGLLREDAEKTMRRFFSGKQAPEIAKELLDYPEMMVANNVDDFVAKTDDVLNRNTAALNDMLDSEFAGRRLNFSRELGKSQTQLNRIRDRLLKIADNFEPNAYDDAGEQYVTKLRRMAIEIDKLKSLSLSDANKLKRIMWEHAKFTQAGTPGKSDAAVAAFDLADELKNAIDKVTGGRSGALNREMHVALKAQAHLKEVPPQLLSVGTGSKAFIGSVVGGNTLGGAMAATDAAKKTWMLGSRYANFANKLSKTGLKPSTRQGITSVVSALFPQAVK